VVVCQQFYVRRQEEDEQKAGQERCVGRDQRPERPVEERGLAEKIRRLGDAALPGWGL
jgi:hypothetical protein